MTDASNAKPIFSGQPTAPMKPPQVPPLKVAQGATGSRATIAPLPNPTLPKPTIPNPSQVMPQNGGLGNLNQAKMGTQSPMPAMPVMPLSQPATLKPPLASSPSAPILPSRPAPSAAPVSTAAMGPASNPAPSPTPAGGAKFAEIRKSPLRFFPFLMGGVLILVLIVFIVSKLFGGASPTSTQTGTPGGTTTNTAPITLTYWGLWEPSAILTQVFSDYESSHPNIRINYMQQPYQDYAVRLQTAIAKQSGPDIFRYHASWVPMLRQELSPMPSTIYSDVDYNNTFYPIAAKQLTVNNSFVGIPLEYDGLELFYNTDFLKTANVQPPTTWADMKRIAGQLTIRDNTNGTKIQRAGLAIGNTSNVDHFSDILGLLLLQNGVNPTDVTSQAAQDALSFYTSFVTQDKVWDATFPDSVTAFARGDVAMIFAPSWRAHDIQSMNPNLKFAVAPVPQLTSTKITWGSYWAEGVNSQSTHQAAAWDFLKYMSSAATMQKFYSEASKVRAFGEIYSRKDLAGSLANDPYVGAFVTDAPYAKNWYLNSATHDNGINDNIIKYFEDAINQASTGNGTSLSSALLTVQQGQAQVLSQYGIRIAVPAASTTP